MASLGRILSLMFGTILNAVGIVVGGVAGLVAKRPLSLADQSFLKLVLGLAAIGIGLRLAWISVGGTFPQVLKQLFIVILAMTVGKLIGKLLRLQTLSNSLGQFANQKIQGVEPGKRGHHTDGFVVCSVLFCVGPLAVIGAVQDGLSAFFLTLALKAVMDGLAVMSFAPMFGWGVILSALPVLAYQGLITLAAKAALPLLSAHQLVDPINATGGLLLFSVALVIFQVKKIELANYLPSLAVAPLIAWLWSW